MSASTPPPPWPVRPPHHRPGPARPRDPTGHAPHDPPPGPPHGPALRIRRTRPSLRAAVDVVARFGTAVTLAALLVVTAAALSAVDATPTPAGATTRR